jgi:hypothetical protein
MTIAQIEDKIRSQTPSERIELYRWLDYMVVADCNVDTSFCYRLEVDRSLETRAIFSKSCGLPLETEPGPPSRLCAGGLPDGRGEPRGKSPENQASDIADRRSYQNPGEAP